MALNTKQAIQELISYTILTDKQGVVNLLKKYGVRVKDKPSDAEVTTSVLVAMKKSKAFKRDLANLLQSKLDKAGQQFSSMSGGNMSFTGFDDVIYMPNLAFTGTDDFSDFTGWDDFQAVNGKTSVGISQDTLNKAKQSAAQATQMASEQKGKTGVGRALSNLWSFTKENVLTKENVNAGIQFGIDRINADSLARQNALEQQSFLLQQQQNAMRNRVGGGVSGNTVLYIGVGIIALVGIGYLIVKQSKK